MVSRRAVLRAAPLAAVPLAGCGDLLSNPADQVSYDHEVRITNDDDTGHTVALNVEDVTDGEGTVVYDERHDVASGVERRTLFDFETLAGDDRREFVVRLALGEQETRPITVPMDGCFGNVNATIDGAGRLSAGHGIC